MYVPFFQRIETSEWPLLLVSLLVTYFETVVNVVTGVLPSFVISSLDLVVRFCFYSFGFKYEFQNELESRLHNARDITELCSLFGYGIQDHVVQTPDGYFLTVHRMVNSKNNDNCRGVVYFHHGLMMNSEIWTTMVNENDNLPFVLSKLGYDVWLGNNRGNKYCKKHRRWRTTDKQFWDFSIDDFAIQDIPTIIDYILQVTKQKTLDYIGFSQGSAQGFAALSIRPDLNDKVAHFVALSPAMTPKGLNNQFIDALMRSSPLLLFLVFGRYALLQSASFWNSIIYAPLFVKIIDFCNFHLFNWKSLNIEFPQKVVSYAHLYSSTSVKVVVHWFQIIRNGKFQMFDDVGVSSRDYSIPSYPTNNITVPIYLLFGDSDSLVDIGIMQNQLSSVSRLISLQNFEHLDTIWSKDVGETVFAEVAKILEL